MTKSEQKAFDKSWDSRNLARSNLLMAVYFFEAGIKYKKQVSTKVHMPAKRGILSEMRIRKAVRTVLRDKGKS